MKKLLDYKIKGLAVLTLMMMLALPCIWAVGGDKPGKVLTGKVVKVADGDTFTMLVKGNKQVKVRMYGIDAPEMTGSQPYCRQSKDKLAEMVAGKQVTVLVTDYDRYGRALGVVSTADCKDVNIEMLKAGLAWHYKQYDQTPAYINAARKAKQLRKGLWGDRRQPVNPANWRKAQKNK